MEFDYVIVGGGTTGCVMAARLAENPDISVALIEGGKSFEHDPLVLGYHGSVPLLGDPRYDYDYGIVSQNRGNSRIRHSRAKMLGGCSGHNDTLAIIPPDRDMDEWEALGATGWSAEALRPYFAMVVDKMHVHRADSRSACAHAIHEGALETGLQEIDVHAGPFADGAGWMYLNERDEIRQSTAVTYLYPLSQKPANLTLLLETWASGLEVDDDGAVHTVHTSRGPVRARSEVILAAGAIDTPRLLLRSGIGPREDLSTLGIGVRRDLPAVGAYFRDHIEIPFIVETGRETGPSLQSAENSIFWRTRPELEAFDAYAHVITQPFYNPISVGGVDIPMPEQGFCIVPNVAKPKSHGTLKLNPADIDGAPLIDPKYFSDEGGVDEQVLVAGLRRARDLVRETSLRDWAVGEVVPMGESDEQLLVYVLESSNTVYHPCGTCRMGSASDEGAVVDPDLRVRGLDGLRIAEASIFPTIPSVNLCMTTVMIGEVAVEKLLQT